MPRKSLEEIVHTIRQKASAWHAAHDEEDKSRVECQMGDEVFRSVFAEDTAILGPWQLKTNGKRKEEKYEEFKRLWDSLRSADDLGVNSRDLLAWCRSVALHRLITDKGLDPAKLGWAKLCEIQRLKSVSPMIEQARMAADDRSTAKPALQEARGKSGHQVERAEESDITLEKPETGALSSLPQPEPVLSEPAAELCATVDGLERILEQPAQLLGNSAYVKLMSDPANFKDLSPSRREQLRRRVAKVAQEMESLARGYRDFEAVLRWSRRL
jgi:hypothetical protein